MVDELTLLKGRLATMDLTSPSCRDSVVNECKQIKTKHSINTRIYNIVEAIYCYIFSIMDGVIRNSEKEYYIDSAYMKVYVCGAMPEFEQYWNNCVPKTFNPNSGWSVWVLNRKGLKIGLQYFLDELDKQIATEEGMNDELNKQKVGDEKSGNGNDGLQTEHRRRLGIINNFMSHIIK